MRFKESLLSLAVRVVGGLVTALVVFAVQLASEQQAEASHQRWVKMHWLIQVARVDNTAEMSNSGGPHDEQHFDFSNDLVPQTVRLRAVGTATDEGGNTVGQFKSLLGACLYWGVPGRHLRLYRVQNY